METTPSESEKFKLCVKDFNGGEIVSMAVIHLANVGNITENG